MPSYAMQSVKLPATVVHRIEAMIRNFVWGSVDGQKSIHLLRWKTLCQPKSRGGSGLKNLSKQNSAFLMKLALATRTQHDSLWVRVLRAKYGDLASPSVKRTPSTASIFWKSLSSVCEDLELGMMWKVGDGKSISFWSDHWVGDGGPLYHLAFAPIPVAAHRLNLAHYMNEVGTWEWSAFHDLLPNHLLAQIAQVNPSHSKGPDECIWQSNGKTTFSVSSAYNLLMEEDWDDEDSKWALAWRWPGLQRIRTFLWLAMHNRLLTNSERGRRHMSLDTQCGYCGHAEEDLNHILRACPLAVECWKLLIPSHLLRPFFSSSFDAWFRSNLKKGTTSDCWCISFGTLCWRLWKRRNDRVFTGTITPAHQVAHQVLTSVKHTLEARRPPAHPD